MITQEKITLFRKYDGDIDGYLRYNQGNYERDFDKDDWRFLSSIFHDLWLVDKGKASDSYKADVFRRIRKNCADEATISLLLETEAYINRGKQ